MFKLAHASQRSLISSMLQDRRASWACWIWKKTIC